MSKHYIFNAIFVMISTIAIAQTKVDTETFPFLKSHLATAPYVAASNHLQKAKALSNTSEANYTHRLDSIIITIENSADESSASTIKLISNYRNNKLISIIDSRGASATSNYSLAFTHSYIYDSQNRLDSLIVWSYNFNAMANGSTYHYTYDASDRINSVTTRYKSSYSNTWDSPCTIEYQYAGNNITTEIVKTSQDQITQATYHLFDAYRNDTLIKRYGYVNNIAQLAKKYTYTYGYYSSGLISSVNKRIYFYNYPDSTQALQYSSSNHEFNNAGNIVQTEDNLYNAKTQELTSSNKSYSCTIDMNIKTSEILGLKENDFYVNSFNALTQLKTNQGTTNYTYNLYYSPLVKTGIYTANESSSSEVKVFSGQTQGSITLQMPTEAAYTISIFTTSGSKIQTLHSTSPTNTIKNLAAGVYFYTISSEKNNYKGKFIVK